MTRDVFRAESKWRSANPLASSLLISSKASLCSGSHVKGHILFEQGLQQVDMTGHVGREGIHLVDHSEETPEFDHN